MFLSYAKIENLPNDANYEGEIEQGSNLRQGLGTCVFKDGSLYHGTWIVDKMTGKGFRVFTNQNYYIGDYANNKMVRD